jgi:hypothetical protein
MKRKETRGGRGLTRKVSMKRVLKCVWSGFVWLRTWSIVTCEHGNEPPASVIGGECVLAEQTALKGTAVWC